MESEENQTVQRLAIIKPNKHYTLNLKSELVSQNLYRITLLGLNIMRLVDDLAFSLIIRKSTDDPDIQMHNNNNTNKIKSFLRGNRETEEVYFFLRAGTELYSYSLEMKIAVKFLDYTQIIDNEEDENGNNIELYQIDEWMKFSDPIALEIPSFLITFEHQPGQVIKFRKSGFADQWYPGTIVQRLAYNDSYLISCQNENENENENDNENNCIEIEIAAYLINTTYVSHYLNIESDRIRKSAYLHLIYRSNNLIMHNINNNNHNQENNDNNMHMSSFSFSENYLFEMYSVLFAIGEQFLMCSAASSHLELQSATEYVTSQILNMLTSSSSSSPVSKFVEPDYEYRINCLITNCDCKLEMRSLMLHKMLLSKDPEIAFNSTFSIQDISFACDICKVYIHEFDLIYYCSGHNSDGISHDICIECVYELVRKHQQVKQLIEPLLVTHLNVHCIQILVQFIVGTVQRLDYA
jgi:hypothetical protein